MTPTLILGFAIINSVAAADERSSTLPEIGVAVGLPAGLMPVLGLRTGPFDVHATGMIWGDALFGGQINFGYDFTLDREMADHVLAMCIGSMDGDSGEGKYGGLVYNLFLRGGFFLEAGFTAGSGVYSNPQLTIQLGYVHLFENK